MRWLLSLICLLLLAGSVAAIDFTARMEPEERTIALNESAALNLILTHSSKSNEQFEIYSPDVQWDLTTDTPERLVTVYPGQEKIVQVNLRPLYVNPGSYVVPIHVRLSGKNQLQKTYVLVNVLTPGLRLGEYLPAIKVTPKLGDTVDPRQNVVLTVLLENLNRKELAEFDLKVRGTLVNADAKTSLNPLEKKEVKLTTRIDPLTPPQKDTLRVTALVSQPDRTYQFDGPLVEYQVIGYGEIELGLTATSALLKQISQYTFTNNGNVERKHTYQVERTFGRMLFSSFAPTGQVVDNGKYYEWQFELQPKESLVVTEVSNYRPLAYVLLVLLVVFAAYLYFRSPMVVAKSAMIIGTREAGISELKVIVQLKNRSKHAVKQVAVFDKVPRIAEVVKDFDVGTIKPVHVMVNEKQGTLLKWQLDELEPGEERIISYKMRSSLSILGGLRLPVATARCTGPTGREHKTASNLMQIGFGEKL